MTERKNYEIKNNEITLKNRRANKRKNTRQNESGNRIRHIEKKAE